MAIINVGGGNSASLNVVKYSSKPTGTAPVGTIGVVTSTEITSVVYSTTQPSASNGRVWLRNGYSATQSVTLPSYQTITLPITTVMQYENGAWNYKQAYIYNGSVWNPTRLIIYENGTGSGNFNHISSTKTAAPTESWGVTPTLNASRSGASASGTDVNGSGFITKNKISLSGYSRLCVTIAGSGSNDQMFGFGLCDSASPAMYNTPAQIAGSNPSKQATGFTESLQTIDLPSGIVEKYVFTNGRAYFPYVGYGSGSYSFYVKEIYAE